MTATRLPEPPTALDRHEGRHLLSSAEALLKGVLEADTPVELLAGPPREPFSPLFDLGARPDVQELLDRHGTALLATPTAARAVLLARHSAASGHHAIALVPNDELDLTMPALEEAGQVALDRGGSLSLLLEDDPYGSPASDPRQVAVRLDLPCLAPAGVGEVRSAVEHAIRLGRAARRCAAVVLHRWVLRSADMIEIAPNRVLDPVTRASIRPRRRAMWAEAGDLTRVARRLELNQVRSVPIRGEQLPLSFIVAGPAAASINHVLHRLGLTGRVAVLELGLINPIDESVIDRVLRHSQEVVVLEPRPGSIEADVLRIAESIRRQAGKDKTAAVRAQPVPDEPNPVLRADEALHPSILARRIVPLLLASHPNLEPPFVPDPPRLPAPPTPRGRGLGPAGALERARQVLADIDQWLHERAREESEPVEGFDEIPTALAVDGAEPEGAQGQRVLTVETWSHRRFLVDGLASLRQAAWDDRPWMFVVCALGHEEVADLVRLAQAAIPSQRSQGARIESANLNDRRALRDLLRTLTATTRLSVVVVHDGPPPHYDVEAMEEQCADIDRLGYEPRQTVVVSARAACAIRRSFDRMQPREPIEGQVPLRTHLTVGRLSRARHDGQLRLRVRPLYEAVEVVRDRPPASAWRRSDATRLELPKPRHARASQWRVHLAGFRGAAPGAAARVLCAAGAHMGYQVRSLYDPSPIGPGRRAWAQVLYTRPQADKGPLPITARIPFGEADLLLGLDAEEGLRAIDADGSLRVAHLDRTYLVANLGAFTDDGEPPECLDHAETALHAVSRDDGRMVGDFAAAARSAFHTDRVTDLVLLGAAYQRGLVPLSHEAIVAGVQHVEARGVGRAMEAFQFGRRLGAGGRASARLRGDAARSGRADEGQRGDIDRVVRRTVRLLRSVQRRFWRRTTGGRLDVDQFEKLIWQTLERTPGLTETDAGRQARRDLVIALHRCLLWGGFEYAREYADRITTLYRADRGDAGRALTRWAILPLAEAMLIRDPIYVATLVTSPGHRRRARGWLNVKTARGDRLTRRFLTRVELSGFQRRVRLDLRTSDWVAWGIAWLRHRIPHPWRGTAHVREIRDVVVKVIDRAQAAPREEYDRWAEALQRLHIQAADDRLVGMALSELRMLTGL